MPRDPGAATAITPQGRRAPSDQYNPQPSHEPPAQAPIAPITQKPKGPVEINNPMKRDNNDTTNNNNNSNNDN